MPPPCVPSAPAITGHSACCGNQDATISRWLRTSAFFGACRPSWSPSLSQHGTDLRERNRQTPTTTHRKSHHTRFRQSDAQEAIRRVSALLRAERAERKKSAGSNPDKRLAIPKDCGTFGSRVRNRRVALFCLFVCRIAQAAPATGRAAVPVFTAGEGRRKGGRPAIEYEDQFALCAIGFGMCRNPYPRSPIPSGLRSH